jgi:hypothetical protein
MNFQIIESQRIKDVLPSLRQICAQAECKLESYWADIITGAEECSEEEGTVCILVATISMLKSCSLSKTDRVPILHQLH